MATRLVSQIRQEFEVELPLSTLFEFPTIEGLARALKEYSTEAALPPIERVDRNQPLPLSYAQQRLWFIDQLEGDSTQYNMPGSLKIIGDFNESAFFKTIDQLLSRHEVLRTVFINYDGEARQEILDDFEVQIISVDLSNLDAEKQTNKIQILLDEDASKPFNLSDDLPIRFQLIKLSEQSNLLLFNLHHIATDGWSMGVLVEEFNVLYKAFCNGEKNPLVPLSIQYVDFACWQRQWLTGDLLVEQKNYWQEQLKNLPPVHGLPLDKERPAQQRFEGNRVVQQLDISLTDQINNLCVSHSITSFMFFQTFLTLLVGRYSGSTDIVIGSPIAGRVHQDVESLIGFFVNTLVLRSDLSANPTLDHLLKKNKRTILEAFSHQYIPFEMLVELLNPERNLSYNPLFQIVLSFQNNEQVDLSLGGLQLDHLETRNRTSKIDLELAVVEHEKGFSLGWIYNQDIFDESTIKQMAEHFEVLIRSGLKNTKMPIQQLPLLSVSERERLLISWNDTDADYPDEICAHEIFEHQVKLTPNAKAIVCGDQSLSYTELNQRANQLANYLRSSGIQPDELVGICLNRSVEMVIAMLGILKSGGAYLPLDPGYPKSRLSFIVADSNMRIVLTQESLRDQLSLLNTPMQCLDQTEFIQQLKGYSHDNISVGLLGINPSNLAYVIYTSGSTGRPKGVMIEHKSLVNYLVFSKYKFLHEDVEGSVVSTSFSFDATICSLYLPLISGKCAFLMEEGDDILEEVSDTMKSSSLLYKLTPAHLRALKHYFDEPLSEKLKHIFVVGGEAFPMSEQMHWQRLFPSAKFVNEYGPTEATVGCSTYVVNNDQEISSKQSTVPIGKPSSNVKLYVLNDQKEPCVQGAVGELFIGGACLARGYLNKPDLTEEKFVYHSFIAGHSERLYRTGDLVRWLPDGNLEFIKRADDQVKLRGFRIELAEIEAVLSQIDGIEQGVVLVRENTNSEKYLVAYVVLERTIEGDEQLNLDRQCDLAAEYKTTLKLHLPEYMIPAVYIFLDSLPLTINGKLDKRSLPEPRTSDVTRSQYVGPRNPVEESLSALWCELLQLQKVSIHDSFFALGGDSISSIQLVARAKQQGIYITTKQVFEHQTIEALASTARLGKSFIAPQVMITGEQILLPIQRDFMNRKLPDAYHYNQAMLLETPLDFSNDQLQLMVEALYKRHDVLRLKFDMEGSASYRDYEPSMLTESVLSYDLSHLQGVERRKLLESYCEKIQSSLNPKQGLIFKVVFFNYGEEAGRLLLVFHHLVIDGVSWRILLSDLEQMYEQLLSANVIKLEEKTSSYQQWGQALSDYANSEKVKAERVYWIKQLSAAKEYSQPLRAENDSGNSELLSYSFQLSESETKDLLGECNTVFRTQINELLLAALMQGYHRATGQEKLVIEMESHGREMLFEGLDVSETMGWFTSIYPFVLTACPNSDIRVQIKKIIKSYRSVPNKGIGYGLLKDIAKDKELNELSSRQESKIVFNYLGRFDSALGKKISFNNASEQHGSSVSNTNINCYPLTIIGRVMNQRLAFRISYSSNEHDGILVKKIAEKFKYSLLEILYNFHAQKSKNNLIDEYNEVLAFNDELLKYDGIEI
ncbi:amino acid adenylation domain-containing protein [Microbulbifer epialgicus]|uniref:Amino acid adenylation domain-containing protein n=1 Tax=Microbulbifer epialgicus TaxID=393907 RepID=A0ABV4P746_9GAMM